MTGEHLYDLGVGKDFLGGTQKALTVGEDIDKLVFSELCRHWANLLFFKSSLHPAPPPAAWLLLSPFS